MAAVGFLVNFYLGLALLLFIIAFQIRRMSTWSRSAIGAAGVWVVASAIVTYIWLPRWRTVILIAAGAVVLLVAVAALRLLWSKRKPSEHVPLDLSSDDRDPRRLASPDMAAKVIEMYGNRCANCGAKDVKLEIDHIIPHARGGRTVLSNLQPLCGPCNRTKSDMTQDEFEDWQRMERRRSRK